MFERMEIAWSIYESVFETSYKKPNRADTKCDGNIRNNRGEFALSKTHPVTGESSGKHQKQYVDISKSESKTCLIHGPGHSSNKCKILGDSGTNYSNSKHTNNQVNNPTPRK